MSARTGVYPLRLFSKLDQNCAAAGALRVSLLVAPSAQSAHGLSANWMIGTQAVMSYSLAFLAGSAGGCLEVRISPDGTNFDLWQSFPIYPGSAPTVLRGVELVGWVVGFSIVNYDAAARVIRGVIEVEAF